MKCVYKGVEYFVISIFGDRIEISPTKHGAGSFYVSSEYVDMIDEEELNNLELQKQYEFMQYAEDAANADAQYYGEMK